MKRRSKRVPRGTLRRKRADWVYRDDGASLTIGGSPVFTPDDLGTYSPNATAMSSPSITGLVLYDSRNYLRQMTHGGGGGPFGSLQAAARSAGRRAMCHMVRGSILIDTSSWAVNDELILGLRIGVFEQDASNGLLSVNALYSMFQNAPKVSISTFANDARQNRWERRIIKTFNDGNSGGTFQVPILARVKVSLTDSECLGLFMELDQGSVNARITSWLSTLVSDEG